MELRESYFAKNYVYFMTIIIQDPKLLSLFSSLHIQHLLVASMDLFLLWTYMDTSSLTAK
jgi:hypothetical protein